MSDKHITPWPSIEVIASDVNSGKRTARSFVEKSFKLIKQTKDHNAILESLEESALKRADEIDAEVKKGKKVGRLAGVPFIAKDNFLTFNSHTTAASNILGNFSAQYQSTAINKLESEGAILVAKANLDSFAHGSSTENSDFGVTLHPRDKSRVPGGSSGGSGASVALLLAPFALGTDTGGSIRLPASFCGVVGLKPSYGLVSRSGVVAMASSTDVIGPIATTVEDAALVLDVMSGKDKYDSTTVERDSLPYTAFDTALKGKKVGIVKEYFGEGLDPEVKEAILAAVEMMKEQGAEIIEVSMPKLELSLACYYILMPAEVSSNLSRYDGQRYGYSADDASNLKDSYQKSRSQGFNAEVKRRILIGTYVLSSGYYDAYYKKAAKLRTLLIEEFDEAFGDVDILVGPTAPMTAFKIGENTEDPLKMYLADIMTVAANLVGVPAISIPVGEDNNKLPIGMQLLAPQNSDRLLLSIAHNFMKEFKG